MLIVAHRVLYRFFTKLRQNLSLPQAKAFRVKYPRAAKLFLSQLAPGIGASLAGLALAIHPKGDRRTTVAVYALMKALEYNYNRLEDEGYFANRPWVSSVRGMEGTIADHDSGLGHGSSSHSHPPSSSTPSCSTGRRYQQSTARS